MANNYNLKFHDLKLSNVDSIFHHVSKDTKDINVYTVIKGAINSFILKNETLISNFKIPSAFRRDTDSKVICIFDKQSSKFIVLSNNKEFEIIETSSSQVVKIAAENLQAVFCYQDSKIFVQRQNSSADIYENSFSSKNMYVEKIKSFGNKGDEMLISKISKSTKDYILLRTTIGLRIHDNDNDIVGKMISCCGKGPKEKWGKVFFADLTGQKQFDIIFFNNFGLYVYQNTGQIDQYKLISYNPSFSEKHGWTLEHLNTIHFEDVYMDPRQEMIVTTPQGLSVLSFDYYSMEWNAILDHSKLSVSDRNAKVVDVIKNPTTGLKWIVTKVNNVINYGELELEDTNVDKRIDINQYDIIDATLQEIDQTFVPPLDETKNNKNKFYLKDFFTEYSDIIKSDMIDRTTGKPSFSLPIVDIESSFTNIKVNLVYNANSKISNIFGLGWSVHLQNMIFLDHQSSVFPENEKYILIVQNTPYYMIRDNEISTKSDEVIYYRFESKNLIDESIVNTINAVMIRYFRESEKWIITTKEYTYVYGQKNKNSIIWDVAWNNWRGSGNSKFSQKQIAIGWYLTSMEPNNGDYIEYDYEIQNDKTESGNLITREIYLKEIHDNYDNKVTFKYTEKTVEEYGGGSLMNSDSFYEKTLTCKKYVDSIAVETSKFQYELNFLYNITENKRLLSAIVQNEPVWYFGYDQPDKVNNVLTSVLFEDGKKIFNYELISFTSSISQPGKKLKLPNNYSINYGVDFILIHYVDTKLNEIVLQMFDNRLENEIFPFDQKNGKKQWPKFISTGTYYVKHIENVIILVTVLDSEEIHIHWFFAKQNDWYSCRKPIEFAKNTITTFSDKYLIAISDKVTIYSLKNDGTFATEKLQNENRQINVKDKDKVIVTSDNNDFYIYDDKSLWTVYKHFGQEWRIKKIIDLPDLLTKTQKLTEYFDLDKEALRFYKMLFSGFTIQLYKNILLLTSYRIENSTLYADLYIYLLDRNRNVTHQEQKQINLFNIANIYVVVPSPDINDHTNYLCNYKYNGKKFVLQCIDFKGDKEKQVQDAYYEWLIPATNARNDNAPWRNIHALIQKAEANRDNMKANIIKTFLKINSKKLCLLHSSLLSRKPTFHEQTIIASNKKFTFDGDQWKDHSHDDIPTLLSLGNDYVLNLEKNVTPTSNITYSLKTSNNENLVKIEIANPEDIVLRYPVYLAYQKDDENIEVIQFLENQMINITKINAGKLSKFSDYHMLVSEKNDSLIFWPEIGKMRLSPAAVVISSQINYDSDFKRITNYKYNVSDAFTIGEILQFSKIQIIPGGDKKRFGYIEEYPNEKKVFYNSQGNMIETKWLNKTNEITSPYEDNSDDNAPEDPETTIMDRSKTLAVAKFLPYLIKNSDVGYFGFEDYEQNSINHITHSKRWIFDKDHIIKNEFSFTGHNFLRLSKKSKLSASFIPTSQNEIFVVSCWLRLSKLQLGTIAKDFKVIIKSKSSSSSIIVLGEVKLQSKNWFYIEAVINLPYIKKMNSLTNQEKVEIEINIDSEETSTIDIDHIRFSPLICNFEALVYEPKTRNLIAKIQTNGLIERIVYDKYQQQIAFSNQYDQITIFNTFVKRSLRDYPIRGSNTEIKPSQGIYETFEPYSFQKLWKAENAKKAWRIKPHSIKHTMKGIHFLKVNFSKFNRNSFGYRFIYDLMDNGKIHFSNLLLLEKTNSERTSLICELRRIFVRSKGEIIVVNEKNRIFVWIDGHLLVDKILNDQQMFDYLTLKFENSVQIRDVMLFDEPRIHVIYFNQLGEKIQEAYLESSNSVIVIEYLYDELGRQDIITKRTRITVEAADNFLLGYRCDFVKNNNPLIKNSVWETNKLEGQVIYPNGFYAYTRLLFADNPLNLKTQIGLPGKDYTTGTKFAKYFKSAIKSSYLNDGIPMKPYIEKLFPVNEHIFDVQINPNQVLEVLVMNEKNQRVGQLIDPINENNKIITTYEYDKNNKLIEILPPVYHERFQRLIANNGSFIEVENLRKLGKYMVYDNNGNLISKQTPETGKTEYIFDKFNLLKFILHYFDYFGQKIDKALYFDYDNFGRLIETGILKNPPANKQDLEKSATKQNKQTYQELYHNDYELQPLLRKQIVRIITHANEYSQFVEEYTVNEDKDEINRRIVIPGIQKNTAMAIDLQMIYQESMIKNISYPVEFNEMPFTLTYNYDKFGRIASIGIPNDVNYFGEFSYNADNQLESEKHSYGDTNNKFIRTYSYNDPGYLTKITDKFLTEKIFYTNDVITKRFFNATWHKFANSNKISLKPEDFVENCFAKLKEAGYINKDNRQERIYYPDYDMNMPFKCKNLQIISHLENKGFPSQYGYHYNYNNLKQMTKAKYYLKETLYSYLLPLTTKSLQSFMPYKDAKEIWTLLVQYGLICNGCSYLSFIKPIELDPKYIPGDIIEDVRLSLQKLIAYYYSKNKTLSLNELKTFLSNWSDKLNKKEIVQYIYDLLKKNNYIEQPLTQVFTIFLSGYEKYFRKIVDLLLRDYAEGIGKAIADVQYGDIDLNGNTLKSKEKFDTYFIKIDEFSNKITHIIKQCPSEIINYFDFNHDSRGNVISAPHKEIKDIVYDPVSNRPTEVTLMNDISIQFAYDAQGGRIMKRVLSSKYKILKEINYIRDHKGQALVEREITYTLEGTPMPDVLVTIYIYGSRGLFGFIRRNEFYSVITDHEGSIRLVVKNGQVVAAYDYLPYGNLMREYAEYPEASISYRYTGKEWDSEIGLYNFHARLYDPVIGRFYQIDPREQYSSPYTYAGNSPVSVIDPDGELAVPLILLITSVILFAAAGAYLGGAAQNNDFNPLNWKWNAATWGNMFFGAVTGALIPIGFWSGTGFVTGYGLVARLATGVGASYLGGAAANEKWNPASWNWKNPETYNGMFSSFGTGSGVWQGYSDAIKFFKTLSSIYKSSFAAISLVFGSAIFVSEAGSAWSDPSNPKFWSAFASGTMRATELSMLGKGARKLSRRNHRTKILLKKLTLSGLGKAFLKSEKVQQHVIFYAIKTAFMSTAFILQGFQTDWDMTSLNTYYNLVSGLIQGSQMSSVVKAVHVATAPRKLSTKPEEEVLRLLSDTNVRQQQSDKYLQILLDKESIVIFSQKMENLDKDFTIIMADKVINSPILKFEVLQNGKGLKENVDKMLTYSKDYVTKTLPSHGILKFSKFLESFTSSQELAKNIQFHMSNELKTGRFLTKPQIKKAIEDGFKSLNAESHSSDQISSENNLIILQEKDFIVHNLPSRIDEAEKAFDAVNSNSYSSKEIIARKKFNVEETENFIFNKYSQELKNVLNHAWTELAPYNRILHYWNGIGDSIFNLRPIRNTRRFLHDYCSRDLVSRPINQINNAMFLVSQYKQRIRSFIMDHISSFGSNLFDIMYSRTSQLKNYVFRRLSESLNTRIVYPQHSQIEDGPSKHRRKRAIYPKYINMHTDNITSNENTKSLTYQGAEDESDEFFDASDMPSENHVNRLFDTNGTLLFLNMLVRKLTRQVFIETKENCTSSHVVKAYALNLTEEFENILHNATIESGLQLDDINFIPYTIISDLECYIINGTSADAFLYKRALKAIPKSKRTKTFEKLLRKHLSEVSNKVSSAKLLNTNDNPTNTNNLTSFLKINKINETDDIWYDANSSLLLQ